MNYRVMVSNHIDRYSFITRTMPLHLANDLLGDLVHTYSRLFKDPKVSNDGIPTYGDIEISVIDESDGVVANRLIKEGQPL